MRAGLCQLQIIWEEKEKTMQKVSSFLEKAKSCDVDIVFFPEMSLTGFSMQIEKTKDSRFGETINRFREVCQSLGIAAGFGWIEKAEGEKAKNHYSVVDDTGKLISDYVKIHPFEYGGETIYFQGGNEVSEYEFRHHKISTAICYDLRFPELFRIMDANCSLVVVPANWPASRREHWKCLLQARAIENQFYVIGVNCVGNMNGLYYSGDSGIWNPQGKLLKSISDKEGLIYFDIPNDVVEYRKRFPVRKDQKIEIRKLCNDNNKCMHDCKE